MFTCKCLRLHVNVTCKCNNVNKCNVNVLHLFNVNKNLFTLNKQLEKSHCFLFSIHLQVMATWSFSLNVTFSPKVTPVPNQVPNLGHSPSPNSFLWIFLLDKLLRFTLSSRQCSAKEDKQNLILLYMFLRILWRYYMFTY